MHSHERGTQQRYGSEVCLLEKYRARHDGHHLLLTVCRRGLRDWRRWRLELGSCQVGCCQGEGQSSQLWKASQRGLGDWKKRRGTDVSFSNVTVALWGLSAASDAGVTERDVIFPLLHVNDRLRVCRMKKYQKLKKSRTSFSLVCGAMFLTCQRI